MELEIGFVLLLIVAALNLGYFLGSESHKKLKLENQQLKKENQYTNKIYRKIASEIQLSEGRNRRLRRQFVSHNKEQVAKDIETKPKRMDIEFGIN